MLDSRGGAGGSAASAAPASRGQSAPTYSAEPASSMGSEAFDDDIPF